MSVILFAIALGIAIVSFFNYATNIYPKYFPISQASRLLYEASDAYTAEEKAYLIREATRLYLQETQTDDKPLIIELESLTPQNTTDQFRKVSSLLNQEFEKRALEPYVIPAAIVMFTVASGGYLALGKYKYLNEKQKTFAFTLVGVSEVYLLIFVVF